MGVLDGVKVLEFAALGPGPVCGMFLADMGADVVIVDRPGGENFGPEYFMNRGKRSIALDLKSPDDHAIAQKLMAWADVAIEGNRPGVMERLKLGPEVALAINPSLIYGRMTGWGQEGPLAHTAGHDGNYVSLAGGYWFSSEPCDKPHLPATLVGDIGGGSMFLLSGILAALLHAQKTGEGQVVDAAIIDGVANLMSLQLAVAAERFERGKSVLDNMAPWSQVYECACGGHFKLAAREEKFFSILLELLGIANSFAGFDRRDTTQWPRLDAAMRAAFASRSRDDWAAVFAATDACATPVLSPAEAAAHPQNIARQTYIERGGRIQPAPAPRFSKQPSAAAHEVPSTDEHRAEILTAISHID